MRVVVSRPAWLVVTWPEHAALQAAQAAVTPDLRLTVEAAVGTAWTGFRPRAVFPQATGSRQAADSGRRPAETDEPRPRQGAPP
eukprot:2099604-Alexandrium_andersonii.AAC.1